MTNNNSINRIVLFKSCFIFFLSLLNPFFTVRGQSSKRNIKIVLEKQIEDVNLNDFDSFNLQDYSETFDISLQMMNDSLSLKDQRKGSLLLAFMAKKLQLEIIEGNIKIDNNETKILLNNFSNQDYHIYEPGISRRIKLAGYLCFGEYTVVLKMLTYNKLFYPFLIFVIFITVFAVFNYLGFIKWNYRRATNIIVLSSIALILILAISFKVTCECNISDYYLYGIYFSSEN